MKNKIFEIRKNLLMVDTHEGRLECLKNTFDGETAYIVGAGPSLNEHSPEKLKNFLSNKLTLAIKQSYDLLGDITDIHIQNFCNYKSYDYGDNNKTICPWLVFDPNQPMNIIRNNIRCDFMLPIYRNNGDMGTTIAEKGDYDAMLLETSYKRPWGPGCMYELAIPIAIYMGCKKIVTIGWDIGDLHGFDKTKKSIFQEHFYPGESRVEMMKTSASHRELQSVVNSTKGLYYWLKDMGIELEIISEKNQGYENIPRIKL